ncbi:MAG: SH3 domain-containing protein [Eubacterium sp.]|nr:SH3 domain-containing protein [Eubacterium sp.]
MAKRNNKNIFKNTFKRHSNGVLYLIIFLLVALITAGAIVMSNMETKKLDEANTTLVVETTTKKKAVEKKTEEATTEDETTEEETTSAGKVKVTTETINIRSKPSENAELIAQAEYDDVFEVIKKQGDWYKINFNGTKGYVSAELVEEID